MCIRDRLKAAYTIAAVTAGSDSSAGCVAGSLEWASGAKAFDQVYYLKTQNQSDVANWNGCTIQSGSAAGKASDELKALAQALGSAFVDDADRINEGYPILSWQAGDCLLYTSAGGDGHRSFAGAAAGGETGSGG